MGRSVYLERELKFEAGIGVPLPDLRPLVGQTVRRPEEQLNTAYFDSMDGRLWARGLTLRHRIGEDGRGRWTLKTPVNSGRRLDRNEISWSGRREDVPPDADSILRGVLRRAPLRQLVELDSVRQRLLLHNDQGAVLAELDDDLVTVSGGPRDGFRFRQVELELGQDSSWSSDAVVSALARAGLAAESTPKLAKALPRPTGRSDHGAPLVDRTATLSDVVRACIFDGFERLVDHDWRLRLDPPDPSPHDVHQARVATRRLRSDLKTLAGSLDSVWVEHVRGDLKWLGAVLGDVRDVDVLHANLAGLPRELVEALDHERRSASARLASALVSERYLRLIDRLDAASDQPPIGGGDAAERAASAARGAVPTLVEDRWRAVRRQARKAAHRPTPERLHRVRIKAKQLRYAAESAVPVVGKPARRLAKAAERVQTTLGEHHDAVTAERWLQDHVCGVTGSVSSPRTAYEAGSIAAAVRHRQEQLQRTWHQDWKRLSRPRLRRWLP